MGKLKNLGKLNIPDWIWWLGIVESRADITKTGRYRVRIMGYHTADTEILPTKDLPYATVINSPTNASTSGIMETPNLLPGSTVIGFFADGEESQMPVIIGSIAGHPKSKNEDLTIEAVFNDPSKQYPRGGFDEPKPEGFGGVDEPDIPRLARDEAAETHYSLITKRAEREKDIRTAKAPSVASQLDDKEGKDYEGKTWEEPYARGKGPYTTFKIDEFTPKYWDALADLRGGGTGVPKEPGTYTSMYPFNQVRETEGGFITETDNTAGNERHAFYHPIGNFEEVQADGTRINKIKGSDYEIIANDKNVLIRGSCNITIAGDAKVLVQGDKYEEIEGNHFVTVHGDRITAITGSDIKQVTTDQNYTIGGMRSARVKLDDDLKVIGKQTKNVAKTKSETVGEGVTELYNGTHNTVVNKTRFLQVGTTAKYEIGTNFNIGVGAEMHQLSAGLMVINSNTTLDIDATETLTMDAPNMSIDGPAGNITSNDVTLHTHTHQTTSMDTGNGANSGSKNASDSPNSGT